ncbi:MAG: CtsR family transcriptional regulator [Eubacteriales bacterium]|nr:CtsR family transcriptional regulator [Eubacteriales bacterium]
MATSDLIARFIQEALDAADGIAELQRSTLADRFHCVPSQINYVISTRFSPEHGYLVESRRGGGGYIRISRVRSVPEQLIMHTINAAGSDLDLQTAAAFISNAVESGALDTQSAGLILAAIGNQALRPLPPEQRGAVRASILKQMLLETLSENY